MTDIPNMVDPSSDLGLLARTVLPAAVSIGATWALKKIAPAVGVGGKRTMSILAGILTAIAAGDPKTLAEGLIALAQGIFGGYAGSKMRDDAVGKPYAATKNEMKQIESCADQPSIDFGNG